MNVRRMVMVMVMVMLFGCMVQGVSATNGTLGCTSEYDTAAITSTSEVGIPNIWVYYEYTGAVFGWHSDSSHAAIIDAVRYNVFDYSLYSNSISIASYNIDNSTRFYSGSGYVQASHFRVACRGYGVSPESEPFYAYQILAFSEEPLSTASGESCANTGEYDIYADGIFLYTDDIDGNYSFPIANGTSYNISYNLDNTTEWHNFTASGSDEIWDPAYCTLPSLSGTITALDGEGIYNLNVTLHDFYLYERDLVDSTFTDTDGAYNFYINDSDDAGPYSLGVSGYCNGGADCSAFRIEAPINPGGESYVFDYTWHIPQNVRIDLQYENGSAVSGALLNMKDLSSGTGVWKTTATDGYTTYTSLQSSKVYADYHGGDNSSGGSAGSDVLHSFQLVPNGQYRWSQFVLSIPNDYVNNTTIPPILPPVDEVNKTDISDMITDSTFVVSVNDVLGAPIPQATVTASAADKNYSGKFTGFTNTSGQWSFPKNSTVGQYDVSAAMTCFLPQTKTRYSSADFTLEYSRDAELPGQDGNGTGGWKSNNSYSNWTMNGTPSDEATTKTKLTSWLTYFMYAIIIMMMLTFFTKK